MKRCDDCGRPVSLRRRLTDRIAEWECAICRIVFLR